MRPGSGGNRSGGLLRGPSPVPRLGLRTALRLRIALGLPAGDPRRDSLLNASREHGDEALPAVTGEHYEGGHWLGTFAVYLVTQAGAGGSQGPD